MSLTSISVIDPAPSEPIKDNGVLVNRIKGITMSSHVFTQKLIIRSVASLILAYTHHITLAKIWLFVSLQILELATFRYQASR